MQRMLAGCLLVLVPILCGGAQSAHGQQIYIPPVSDPLCEANCPTGTTTTTSTSSGSRNNTSAGGNLNNAIRQEVVGDIFSSFLGMLFSSDSAAEQQKQRMMQELQARQAAAEKAHQAAEAKRIAELCRQLEATLKLSGTPDLALKGQAGGGGDLQLKLSSSSSTPGPAAASNDPRTMSSGQLADLAQQISNLPPETQQRLMSHFKNVPGVPEGATTPAGPDSNGHGSTLGQLKKMATASKEAADTVTPEDITAVPGTTPGASGAISKAGVGFDTPVQGDTVTKGSGVQIGAGGVVSAPGSTVQTGAGLESGEQIKAPTPTPHSAQGSTEITKPAGSSKPPAAKPSGSLPSSGGSLPPAPAMQQSGSAGSGGSGASKPAAADPAKVKIGTTPFVEGEAYWLTDDGRKVPIEKGGPVYYGEHIVTGMALVRLEFNDGTTIEVRKDSDFVIDNFTLDPAHQVAGMDASLNFGSISWATGNKLKELYAESIGKWAKRFEVRTPAAVIAVRGTEFEMNYQPKSPGSIRLHSGELEITSLKTGEVIPLHAGQMIEIRGDGTLTPPQPLPKQ